jgi:hypothetical protein
MLTAVVLHATHPHMAWHNPDSHAGSVGLAPFGKRLGLPSLTELLYAVTITTTFEH